MIPVKSSSMTIETARRAQLDALKLLDAELPKEVAGIKQALTKWVVRFQSDLSRRQPAELLESSSALVIHGILLSCRLHRLLHTSICGHFELGVPLPKVPALSLRAAPLRSSSR